RRRDRRPRSTNCCATERWPGARRADERQSRAPCGTGRWASHLAPKAAARAGPAMPMNAPGQQRPSPPVSSDQLLAPLFRLDGRIGRWTFFLAVMLLTVLQGLALYQFAIAPEDSGQSNFWASSFWVIGIFSMWCTFALGVKRLHDIGKPGILALTLFVPVL